MRFPNILDIEETNRGDIGFRLRHGWMSHDSEMKCLRTPSFTKQEGLAIDFCRCHRIPEYRGRGRASALTNGVIGDVKSQGRERD